MSSEMDAEKTTAKVDKSETMTVEQPPQPVAEQNASAKVEDKSAAEIERLKKALASRQSAEDAVKKELSEFKAKVEREAMTEAEKREADLAKAREELAAMQRELTDARGDNKLLQQTNHLVAKHGLMNTQVSAALMAQYNPDVDGDLDSFAERIKQEPSWAPLFAKDSRPSVPPPSVPGTATSGTRAAKPENTPADLEWATAYAKKMNVPVETLLANMQRG